MTTEHKIYHTLRLASAMCLIGHGAFGIITKAVWCKYLAVVGIDQPMAYQLMPVIGTIDIVMGISLLIFPTRIVLLWLVFWGLLTAVMRPLSGEPLAELLERAGNFGAPMALLFLFPKANGFLDWFEKLYAPDAISDNSLEKVVLCLRVIAGAFLIGHGLLNLIGKKALLLQYDTIGFKNPILVGYITGTIELIAGTYLLVTRPVYYMILFFLIWKISTEVFYPQWWILEWIERGGSYGTLLALLFLLKRKHIYPKTVVRSVT